MKKLLFGLIFSFSLTNIQAQVKPKGDDFHDFYWKFHKVGPGDEDFTQVEINIKEGGAVSYRKIELYDLKYIKRIGKWNLNKDTLTIFYQNEWIQPAEKVKHENGYSWPETNDSTITRTEPFAVKYLMKKNERNNTRLLCPVTGGDCLHTYPPYMYE